MFVTLVSTAFFFSIWLIGCSYDGKKRRGRELGPKNLLVENSYFCCIVPHFTLPIKFIGILLLMMPINTLFSGYSQMSWKERKKIEDKKVVSLGGKVSSFLWCSLCYICWTFIKPISRFVVFFPYAGSSEAEITFKCGTTNDEKTKGARAENDPGGTCWKLLLYITGIINHTTNFIDGCSTYLCVSDDCSTSSVTS